jgi:hypothetical protein
LGGNHIARRNRGKIHDLSRSVRQCCQVQEGVQVLAVERVDDRTLGRRATRSAQPAVRERGYDVAAIVADAEKLPVRIVVICNAVFGLVCGDKDRHLRGGCRTVLAGHRDIRVDVEAAKGFLVRCIENAAVAQDGRCRTTVLVVAIALDDVGVAGRVLPDHDSC